MRFGIHFGPFSAHASDREVASVVEVLIIATIAFVVIGWPLSLVGHAIGVTPSWHQLTNENQAWLHEHYPKVGLRYLAVAAIVIAAVAAVVVALAALDSRRSITLPGPTFTSRAAEDQYLRSAAETQAADLAARRARNTIQVGRPPVEDTRQQGRPPST